MKSVYVIMKNRETPLFFARAVPHEAVLKLKDAKNRVDELNDKAVSNFYWYEKVPVTQKD